MGNPDTDGLNKDDSALVYTMFSNIPLIIHIYQAPEEHIANTMDYNGIDVPAWEK